MQVKARSIWQQIKPFLFGAIGSVTIWNGLVAVAAFFKDVLMASYLGTSVQADAFTLAYFIPDTISTNIIGMAIGISCVPVFSKLYARGELGQLWSVARSIAVSVFMLSLALTILLYLFSSQLIGMFIEHSVLADNMLPLLKLMLPIIVIAPILIIGYSILQSIGSFLIPAGSWAILHVMIIGLLLFFIGLATPQAEAIKGIALVVTLGMIILAWLAWRAVFRKTAFTIKGPIGKNSQEDLKDIWRVFVPYILILISIQAVYFIERKLAAGFDSGTVAGLNYAFRLSQFPIWVFVAAVSAVILPSLSKDIALGRKVELQQTVARFIAIIGAVCIPTTFIFYLLREPIVSILLQHGAFNQESVRITTSLLKGYSLTIIGLSLSAVCTRYYFAATKMRVPIVVYFLSSVLNILLDYHFMRSMGAEGLGYGAAIAATFNGGMFLLLLAINLKLSIKKAIYPFFKLMLANVTPLLIIMAGTRLWKHLPGGLHFMLQAGFIALLIGTSLGIYVITLRSIKINRFLMGSSKE